MRPLQVCDPATFIKSHYLCSGECGIPILISKFKFRITPSRFLPLPLPLLDSFVIDILALFVIHLHDVDEEVLVVVGLCLSLHLLLLFFHFDPPFSLKQSVTSHGQSTKLLVQLQFIYFLCIPSPNSHYSSAC
ncbi:hypothetical protein WR25_02788 [Diploscapter pachys]|uniref:Uncharacterized protein n=1 Tax=Diploscapter pachys TaxID=2018661 RepID=A0A2A2LA14_9BILA|nr:hypothetical protein WR25_02788 [Diploscapter pachys]